MGFQDRELFKDIVMQCARISLECDRLMEAYRGEKELGVFAIPSDLVRRRRP
jgi:hypothetical protein